MSADPRRVTKTEVWVGWENQVVNSAYPLRRFLGGSNHSAVFLTEYRPEGVTQAAIKLVPADTLETEAQLVQWGTAATLNHPHLIRLFDVGRTHIGGRVFLYVVMEYADQTLAQLLPRRALTPEETREMLIPALSGLNFLHRNNLVQGQMKPTNFLVVGDQLKLASDTIRSVGKLSSGILRASLNDPPELKDGEIAPAGDIWGLGVTLVEALTQHPPSWPDSKSETVSLTASIPPLFVDTVRRCLNRVPGNRPTAAELQGQFDPAVHAHPITVVAAEEPVYEVSTVSAASNDEGGGGASARKGSGGGILLLGAAAVLVLGLAVWVSRTIFVAQFEGGGTSGAKVPAVVAAVGSAGTGDRTEGASASTAQAEGVSPPSSPRPLASPSSSPPPAVSAGPREAAAAHDDRTPQGLAASAGAPTSSAPAPAPAGTDTTANAPAPRATGAPRAPGATGTAGSPQTAAPAVGSAPTAAALSVAPAPTSAPNADLSAQSPDIVGSVLHQQLPDIPRNIRERIRGHVNVTVRVLVDPAGNVVGEFFESAGPSRYFARMAGDAATDWKFVPSDGRGARVWMLRFEFTRATTTVRAIGTQ